MIEENSSQYFPLAFRLKAKSFVILGYSTECRVRHIVLNLVLRGKLEIYSLMVAAIFLKTILTSFRRKVLYIDLDIYEQFKFIN